MRNKRSNNKQEESSSSDVSSSGPTVSDSKSSSSSSLTGKRAADMLANYKSNLEPSSGTNSSSGKNSNNSSGSAVLSEVRDGAQRLATELDEYLSQADSKQSTPSQVGAPLSDEAIADLQLATARKLREVRLKTVPV